MTFCDLLTFCVNLGQFWNIPVTVQPFTPAVPYPELEDDFFNVTVSPPDSPPRSFLGDSFPRTWDNTKEHCLYVGNGQGGWSGEFQELPDSVIEGRYNDYIVDGMFETDFKFSRMEGSCV